MVSNDLFYLDDELDEDQDEQELFEHFRIDVDQGQNLLRMDRFILAKIPNVSRSRIQAAADAGNIIVNGKPTKSSYRVKPGDSISIMMPHPPLKIEIIPQEIPINIVFEDDTLLVVNKDPGMVVHPGHGNYSGTLVNALMYHLRNVPLFSSGEIRPGVVHRIDKNTSGLVVIAKTERAMNHLSRQFFERTAQRAYMALVWGDMKEDEGTIDAHIGRGPSDRMKMFVFPNGESGRNAITHWRVVERLGYVTLVECHLETGRTHQIRVHLNYIRHPIFNDDRYGGDLIMKGPIFTKYKQFVEHTFSVCPRHALHAKSLGFTHPQTGEKMFFESDLPDDMQQVIALWRDKYNSQEPM